MDAENLVCITLLGEVSCGRQADKKGMPNRNHGAIGSSLKIGLVQDFATVFFKIHCAKNDT